MSDLKKHILIIEDEPDIAELLEYNLKTAGYRTTKANNGEIGLEKARDAYPDLILLDLMLPGLHGLDVCRILKTDKETEIIPIMMLTALGDEDDIVKGLEIGADDYVTKPYILSEWQIIQQIFLKMLFTWWRKRLPVMDFHLKKHNWNKR